MTPALDGVITCDNGAVGAIAQYVNYFDTPKFNVSTKFNCVALEINVGQDKKNYTVKGCIWDINDIFGVLPLNHNEQKINPQDFFVILLMPLAYIAAVCGIFLKKSTVLELNDCYQVCLISNTTLLFLGVLSYLVCIYCSFEKKKFFYKFQIKINEFDADFRTIKLKEKIQLEKDYIKISVFSITVLTLVLALIWDIRWKFLSYQNDFIRILLSISGLIFPFLSSALVQAQLIILVEAIVERFKKINFVLNLMDKEASKHAKDFFDSSDDESDNNDADDDDSETRNDDKKNQSKEEINDNNKNEENQNNFSKIEKKTSSIFNIEDAYKHKLNKFNLANQFNSKSIKNNVQWKNAADAQNIVTSEEDEVGYETFLVTLFKLHNHLNELGILTNIEYSIQVVVYMTTTFIVSIIGIFLETKVIFTMTGQFSAIDNLAVTFVVWMIFFMVVAYLVLRLCCQAHNESRNTAILVHEIMQKKPSFMVKDDNYYTKMKNFTLQYLHWERYFQFNGTGLFALDYTFIFSAVSAATSYLIVLLQFDMTSVLQTT